MTPADKIILIITRGEKRIFEGEGFYDIWTFSKDGVAVVAIRDVVTDIVVFEELPIGSMNLSAPFVYIQTKRA